MTKHAIITDLVKNLIQKQFPIWRDLSIKPVAVQGWDNKTFRLGDQMLVRMPSSEEYAPKIIKEQKYLPFLAPLLPFSIPTPIAIGKPDETYSYEWSIYNWIDGDTAAASALVIDMEDLAIDLAKFIIALENININDSPLPVLGDFSYIGGLAYYDTEMRQAIDIMKDKVDMTIATKIWEKALETTWQGAPVWVHGDIGAGNLIMRHGKLHGVIDFGGLSIGDPACDLVIAWKFFDKKSREIFKNSLYFDTGTWNRARGWAFWKAMIIEAGMTASNPVETSGALYTIKEIIKEYKDLNHPAIND